MEEIDKLVETCRSLCDSIDSLANQDRLFCADIQHILDAYSWEAYKMMNHFKELKEYMVG